MKRPLVAVFGSGGSDPQDRQSAFDLGAAIAEAGFDVMNGGYGGTMESSAAGAKSRGGAVLGITCSQFTDRAGANRYCDEVVEAPSLLHRLSELISRADAYVVLPGGSGTLVELALVWEHCRKGLIEGRPLIVWDRPWRSVLEALDQSHVAGGITGIVWVRDVDQAVSALRRSFPQAE